MGEWSQVGQSWHEEDHLQYDQLGLIYLNALTRGYARDYRLILYDKIFICEINNIT